MNAQLQERYDRRLQRIVGPLSRHLRLDFDANPFRPLAQRFAIACCARTGSYLLCERLLKHGAVTQECFLPERIIETCRNRGMARLQEYCVHHLAANTPNGVFGVKGQFDILAPLALAGEFPAFRREWRFVYLTRIDVLKQAISYVIAEQTLAWRSFKAPVKALSIDDFDGRKIAETAQEFTRRYKTWEETFRLFAIEPLRITYEELASDPAGVTAAVAAYLDLRGPPITEKRFIDPPMQVQATDLNARWEARFHEEGWDVEATAR